jgi:hypothetical protein
LRHRGQPHSSRFPADAAKLYLSGTSNEEGVKPSSPPRVSLRASWRNLIGPPLRSIRASGQSATNDFFYFLEAKFNFPKFMPLEIISKGIID